MKVDMVCPMEVGIVCRDLPALRRFYEDGLGFEFISQIDVPAEKASESALSHAAYRVVRLQTSYGERIKLLAPSVPPAGQDLPRNILDRQGLAYLSFLVADIDAAMAGVAAAGADFITGTQRVEVRPGVYLAFCRDPEGNMLELVEYQDVAAYRAHRQSGKA